MALVPYSDARLKPRNTKLIVAATGMLVLGCAAFTTYWLWPRAVFLVSDETFDFGGLDTETARNCPPVKTDQCQKRACSQCTWPYPPYTFCDEDVDPYNQTICDSLRGCVDLTRIAGGYRDCITCQTLPHAKCTVTPSCVWIQPNNSVYGEKVSPFCESSSMGPVSFVFNYSFTVVNTNYVAALTSAGVASLFFTDTESDGEEKEIVVSNTSIAASSVPANSNRTFILPMNVTVGVWNFTNGNASHPNYYTPDDALKRSLIRDTCTKCGAFEEPSLRNQVYMTMRMNLTSSVLSVKASIAHDHLIGVKCNAEPRKPTTTAPPHSTSAPPTSVTRTGTTSMHVPTYPPDKSTTAPPVTTATAPEGHPVAPIR